MADNEDIFNSISLDMAAKIESDSYFSDISVLHYRKADIVDEINARLGAFNMKGGKCGACVIVLQPIIHESKVNAIQPNLNGEFTIRVLENPTVNDVSATGTTKQALSIAVRLTELFKLATADGLYSALTLKEPPIMPVKDDRAPVAYEVGIIGPTLLVPTNRVARPSASPTSGVHPQTVTLSCATASASIYYTTDGSFPRSGNTTATLYTSPFTLASAATLRIGAYKTGMLPSDIPQYTYT